MGSSLRRRGHLTLLEMRFEFPFNLISKSTMGFLTGQSWRVFESWYIGGGPEQGFRRCVADGLGSRFWSRLDGQ